MQITEKQFTQEFTKLPVNWEICPLIRLQLNPPTSHYSTLLLSALCIGDRVWKTRVSNRILSGNSIIIAKLVQSCSRVDGVIYRLYINDRYSTTWKIDWEEWNELHN